MINDDCFQPIYPVPVNCMMPQCTGEQCVMYKIAMKNPRVKEIMDYIMKKLKETDNLKEKLELGIIVDLILKEIAEEDEVNSPT